MSKKKPIVKSVSDSTIFCPFFKYQDKKYSRVACEGFPDNSIMSLGFDNSDYLNSYLRDFCAGDPTSCRFYRLLMEEKYPGVENLNFKGIKEELYYHG